MKKTTSQKIEAIRKAWCHESSSRSDWSEDEPSKGQCVVSALLVQHLFGGDILRNKVSGNYWNNLSGVWVDVTRDRKETQGSKVSRSALLKDPDIKERYLILKNRFYSIL